MSKNKNLILLFIGINFIGNLFSWIERRDFEYCLFEERLKENPLDPLMPVWD